MKHRNIQCIICIIIPYILSFFMSSCKRPERNFIIGVSQCSDDEWRRRMNEEIMREALFYPDLKVEIKTVKDNSREQTEDIERFISQGVDLLIVSPNEAEYVTPAVERAYDKGIPVVLVDRKTASDKYTAFVGGDNYMLGRLAGEYIADRLKGKGVIAELTGLKGSTPAYERQKGLHDALKDFPGIRITASADAAWLKEDAERLADSILKTHEKIDLIFAQNDRMAVGAYEAAKRYGKEKEMLFMGVDALSGEGLGVDLVADGILDASFIYPTGGDKAIQVAMDILQGRPYERENLLPSAQVDAGNARIMQMETAHIRALDDKIRILNRKLDISLERYSSQKRFLYACMVILSLLAVLLFSVVKGYRTKTRLNRELSRQKLQLEEQRNRLADLSRRLEEATKAKLTFFTNVSHDFRTPLALIADPARRLAESDCLKGDDRYLLGLINKNVAVLSRLVNQIMDFRKFENGRLEKRLSEFNIRDYMMEWAEAFRTLAYRKHISLGFNAEDEDYTVTADKEMMERMTYNLLSNAFKFTPPNGRIDIYMGRKGDEGIVMRFSDTGVGMPAEHVGHIFESFYQADVRAAGSGIGLSLVKAFVELHHGSIGVESSEGSGMTFTVIIPARQEGSVSDGTDGRETPEVFKEGAVVMADQDGPSAWEGNASGDGEKKGIVLVIDDNRDVRDYVNSLLRGEYTVIAAANGEEGCRAAIANVPDIIICDVMMPVMDGLECCRRLKAEPRTSHIPVLMLTACSMDEQKTKGYECGADSYIPKPFSSWLLKARVRNLMDNRKRLEDFFGDRIAVSTAPLADADKSFVRKLRELIDDNMGNPCFSVEDMGEKIGFSRVQLYRKAKALTGYAPNELLRKARLNRADAIIKVSEEKSVSEIAYEVGFSSPSYFTKCYKDFFGENPTDILKRRQTQKGQPADA